MEARLLDRLKLTLGEGRSMAEDEVWSQNTFIRKALYNLASC
ncbi:hypothetical protein FNYG_10807 [Fusarium nygamai]|uniref:Uncharacterized protein n=1 Tax=Gibberella nygamai TaxID=42673 RepID=A0A2K0W0Z2_GIBNY|nr:hypothetical protein FNYG_10807 [Fusarium nygamai]